MARTSHYNHRKYGQHTFIAAEYSMLVNELLGSLLSVKAPAVVVAMVTVCAEFYISVTGFSTSVSHETNVDLEWFFSARV